MDMKLLYEYTKELSVLYVEDDAGLRETTAELFSNYFAHLETADDGLTALNIYNRNPEKFDLVISDISMPNLDGIDMSIEILKTNSEMPIIFISAHNEVEYLQRAIEIGVYSFITKPIANQKLYNAIYRASQSISDRKFVMSHLDLIERLNLELEEKNSKLHAQNKELEKSLRMLDTMVSKEQISDNSTCSLNNDEDIDDALEMQIQQLVNEDLHELRELHTEIDMAVIEIINTREVSEYSLSTIVSCFNRYSSALSFYTFFNKLGHSMKSFTSTMDSQPLPNDKEQVEHIFMLLESFLYVLKKWQNEIEVGNLEMINFFDASIINDMETIASLWVKSDDTEEDFGDMEFF